MKSRLPATENVRPHTGALNMTAVRIVATATLLVVTGFANCFAQSTDLAALGDVGDEKLAALESAMTPGKLPGDVVHPCDAFTSAQLTELFGEEAEAATVERGRVQNDVSCAYKWANPNDPAADKEAFQAAFMEAMTSGGNSSAKMDKVLSMAKQSEFKLTISFNYGGDFKSEADAVDGLDKMVARLTKGVGDENFSYSAAFEPSSDIGAKAVWSEKLRQVTVVSGTYLYHVRLQRKADAASDRDDAESVARMVAEKL